MRKFLIVLFTMVMLSFTINAQMQQRGNNQRPHTKFEDNGKSQSKMKYVYKHKVTHDSVSMMKRHQYGKKPLRNNKRMYMKNDSIRMHRPGMKYGYKHKLTHDSIPMMKRHQYGKKYDKRRNKR